MEDINLDDSGLVFDMKAINVEIDGVAGAIPALKIDTKDPNANCYLNA